MPAKKTSKKSRTKNPYIAKVLDGLADLPSLRSRPMFGGYGLYSGQYFFALVWQGELFFFTDEKSRLKYKRAGMGPFVFKDGQKEGNYFAVPPAVFADSKKLTQWAKEAVECRKRFESAQR